MYVAINLETNNHDKRKTNKGSASFQAITRSHEIHTSHKYIRKLCTHWIRAKKHFIFKSHVLQINSKFSTLSQVVCFVNLIQITCYANHIARFDASNKPIQPNDP